MPGDITIVSASLEDLPSIKQLLAELTEAVEDTEGFDLQHFDESIHQLVRGPTNHILVARDEGRLLGFVSFNIRRTLLHPGSSGLIDELVVEKTSRGSGVGRRLIDAAIEKCRELGCCEVEVSTEKSNTRARRFYRACGFEEDAVLLEMHL
jgi:ribosomal protein S18 acetylase RimI-like enzyme